MDSDLGIEILVAPLGVHVGNTQETDIVIEADILGQRTAVFAHVPLADALSYVSVVA